MKFDLHKSIEILERTPVVLETLLKGLSDEWTTSNEGPDTWSAYDIIGHLIHGEETDWIVRMEIILAPSGDKKFEPYDRFAQFKNSKGKSLQQLLNEFKMLRERNLKTLKAKHLTESDFSKTGIHPKFGDVTLAQLLATWAVHDLAHTNQITRVMAKQYAIEAGPFKEYLRILKS